MVPTYHNRANKRAEASRDKKPLCPINYDARQNCMTITGPNGSRPLRWAHDGKLLKAGELPSGCKVDIDVFTGLVKLPGGTQP